MSYHRDLKVPSTNCKASRTTVNITTDFENKGKLCHRQPKLKALSCFLVHFLTLSLLFYPPFPSFWSRPRTFEIITLAWILLMTEECAKLTFNSNGRQQTRVINFSRRITLWIGKHVQYSVSLYSRSERSIKDAISSDGHNHLTMYGQRPVTL